MSEESTEVTLKFTEDELLFLVWAMEFLEGGVSGIEEEQREQMEFKARKALSNLDDDILGVYGSGTLLINCGFCKGSGVFPTDIYPNAEIVACPVCDGKGFNTFNTNHDNLMKCRFCDGDGMAWDSSGYATGEICHVCHGTGFVNLKLISQNSIDDFVWNLIHPSIVSVSKDRFQAGHYSDSVESAFKEINKVIKGIFKSKTGEELDGAKLMYRVFSSKQPIICIGDLTTESGRNIQKGYMQIYAGVMTGIRNPSAHDNLEIETSRATHLLTLASLLMNQLDESI